LETLFSKSQAAVAKPRATKVATTKTPATPAAVSAPAATSKTATTETSSKPVRSEKLGKSEPKSVLQTTIEARIDIGFGNSLFVRGEGEGLSWDRGLPLECVDAQTWRWAAKAADAVKFKLLVNDAVWAQGEDVVARPGEKVEIVPVF